MPLIRFLDRIRLVIKFISLSSEILQSQCYCIGININAPCKLYLILSVWFLPEPKQDQYLMKLKQSSL